ncbi:hypothetical protein LSAT2_032014 [Lamellibrachia satsuma]|nr:hypothetical protein LSAT2_032014 [Lamellibrachia satsuma]
MWKHLHKHNIILHFQHGFQSGLSCESQLIETVHDWMTAMDNKIQIDAILLDFAKAFDKMSTHVQATHVHMVEHVQRKEKEEVLRANVQKGSVVQNAKMSTHVQATHVHMVEHVQRKEKEEVLRANVQKGSVVQNAKSALEQSKKLETRPIPMGRYYQALT